jgi:hypothetical protein
MNCFMDYLVGRLFGFENEVPQSDMKMFQQVEQESRTRFAVGPILSAKLRAKREVSPLPSPH